MFKTEKNGKAVLVMRYGAVVYGSEELKRGDFVYITSDECDDACAIAEIIDLYY